MTLCNQGCGTRIRFRDGKPVNESDTEVLHSTTCMSLKMGKWMGGMFNTIPMGRIQNDVERAHIYIRDADTSRNVDEILIALKTARAMLLDVIGEMEKQRVWNEGQLEEFDEYKTKLVQEQARREDIKGSKVTPKK